MGRHACNCQGVRKWPLSKPGRRKRLRLYVSGRRESQAERRQRVTRRLGALACLWQSREVSRNRAKCTETGAGEEGNARNQQSHVNHYTGFLIWENRKSHSPDPAALTCQAGKVTNSVAQTGGQQVRLPHLNEAPPTYSLSLQLSPKEKASLIAPDLPLFDRSRKSGCYVKPPDSFVLILVTNSIFAKHDVYPFPPNLPITELWQTPSLGPLHF